MGLYGASGMPTALAPRSGAKPWRSPLGGFSSAGHGRPIPLPCQLSSLPNPSRGPSSFASLRAALFPRLLPQTGWVDPVFAGFPKAELLEGAVRPRPPLPDPGPRFGERGGRALPGRPGQLFHLLFTSNVLAGGVSSARWLCQRLSPCWRCHRWWPSLCVPAGGWLSSGNDRAGVCLCVPVKCTGAAWIWVFRGRGWGKKLKNNPGCIFLGVEIPPGCQGGTVPVPDTRVRRLLGAALRVSAKHQGLGHDSCI